MRGFDEVVNLDNCKTGEDRVSILAHNPDDGGYYMQYSTLDQIVVLSEAEQDLLNTPDWDAAERKQFDDIRAALAKLWTQRRAELTFNAAGPPRMVSAPDPRSVPQIRRFAHGIAPLPSGSE